MEIRQSTIPFASKKKESERQTRTYLNKRNRTNWKYGTGLGHNLLRLDELKLELEHIRKEKIKRYYSKI